MPVGSDFYPIHCGRLAVDLQALGANYRRLASLSASAVGAVVKADAYGLGARPVARALEKEGCRTFFVAHLSEAIDLRPHLRKNSEVFVLNGVQPGAEGICLAADVFPVLNSLEQAWRWRDHAQDVGSPLPAALQVDSGMSRLGLTPEEVSRLAHEARFFEMVPLRLIMSHLACGEDAANSSNPDQAKRFESAAAQLPAASLSLANSGGLFLGNDYHYDLVRTGIGLYGGAPSAGAPNPMAAVVRLTASVIQVRRIEPGQGVGYGLTFTADRPMDIATISVGYADGWPRTLSNRGAAYHCGIRLPIVGRVSMDSFSVDISAMSDRGLRLALGDEVELIGPHQSLEDVARDADTISHDILTGLGRRFQRSFITGSETNQPGAQPALADAQ